VEFYLQKNIKSKFKYFLEYYTEMIKQSDLICSYLGILFYMGNSLLLVDAFGNRTREGEEEAAQNCVTNLQSKFSIINF
jgi:hypothetical protein